MSCHGWRRTTQSPKRSARLSLSSPIKRARRAQLLDRTQGRRREKSSIASVASEPQYSPMSSTIRPTEDRCEHSLANDWTADRTVRTVSFSSTCTVMIADSNAASSSHLLKSNEWQNSSFSVPYGLLLPSGLEKALIMGKSDSVLVTDDGSGASFAGFEISFRLGSFEMNLSSSSFGKEEIISTCCFE